MNQQQPRQHDEENQLRTPDGAVGGNSVGQPLNPNLLSDLVLAVRPELMYKDHDDKTVVNLATLQRMVIFQLQVDILDGIAPLFKSLDFTGANRLNDEKLRRNLSDYVRAVRDYDLMVEHQKKAEGSEIGDPFCISARWTLTQRAMNDKKLEPQHSGYSHGTLEQRIGSFDQRTRINKSRDFKALVARFTMAILGGILLIGPMLLMVYRNDLNTSIVTTSVAVVIFSAIMTFYTNASPEVVVGTVAAYAAVLVVFVGTIFQGMDS